MFEKASDDTKKVITLTKSLEENISIFESVFYEDEMLIIRRFQNKYLPAAKCCVIYFEEMIKSEILNNNVIRPLLSSNLTEGIVAEKLLEEIQYKVIMANNVRMISDINQITEYVIYGSIIFLLEGYDKVLVIDSKGWQARAITEPESTKVVRGPRAGFTETIDLNISLIRRIVKDSNLKFKFRKIGERTHTRVCICYIEGLALQSILKELERRLNQIQIDAVLDSGYIQELIRDAPFSPFETVGYSEKPDVIAGKLLEGRVAVLVDGSPFVLTVPFIILEATQASEDYYNNYIFASINRLFRTTATILAISIPSLYLAVITYHQEMLPTPLLLSVSAGRQGVPFPSILSLIIVLEIFDLLREASVRMPTPIGQAINIVGTLILGQALVEANLVSSITIIVTALSGILSLMNIAMAGATIVIRTFLLLCTSILGIYGFLFGFIVVIIHLMSIRSFGVPYMMNISTVKEHNFQDAWIRAPWWEMTLRPKIIGVRNLIRQSTKKNRGK